MKDYSAMSDFEINKAVDDILHPPKPRHIKAYNSNYCNNPADAWPLLLSIISSGAIISISSSSVNGEPLNGKSITRKITELYLSLQAD